METLENYVRTIGRINETWWRQAEPLEKRLKDLESQYKAIGPVGTDPDKAARAKTLEQQITACAKSLNDLYQQWTMNLRLVNPPPAASLPSDWADKIPWPNFVPSSVKQLILKSIKQKGLAVSDRVTLKKGPGTVGLELEIKW